MGKTVLFSPVGGTDPISINNMHDGSLLHICRYYNPDEVVMYMSKEIAAYDEEDNRYEEAIHRLCKKQKRAIIVKKIKKDKLENVQEFDFFYKEFSEILFSIRKKLDEDDRLLVNVSSGTPAMKSGLLVLVTLGEIDCSAIQVSTPVKGMNEHEHKGFDLETLWELDPDNENGENRCQEVICPTLSCMQKQEIIKRHLISYDYPAAVAVAETMPKRDTEQYINLLQLADARAALDNNRVGKLSNGNKETFFPIWSSGDRKLFEYALIVDLKRKRGEYADFVRSFTPLFVNILEQILKRECHFIVEDYVNKWGRWTIDRIPNDLKNHLDSEFDGAFKGGYVLSVHLVRIADFYMKDKELLDVLHQLRDMEENVRNDAAHQITSLSDDDLCSRTGLNSKQIMDRIQKIFPHTGAPVKKEYWDSYEEMNRKIIAVMDKTWTNQ